MLNNIRPGSIIKSSNWPEPVEIKFMEETGEYVHIVGATTLSREHIDQIIPVEEFSRILTERINSAFSTEPWKVFLALETIRYRFASIYDPLLAMNTSKVDPLPHQIEAVYGYVLKLPRIRFLIADDPGAGKTIMAGLIIKELKLRHIIKRILIVAPGHLKDQWQRELSDRFEEKFVRIDREILDALYGENVWMRENQIITSIDFAKREEVIPSICAAHFDLIVVDEAHKMSAYRYGDKTDKTERYKLGEALSRISEHLLFLTATPHKGDPENFRLFLDLTENFFKKAFVRAEGKIKERNDGFLSVESIPYEIRRVTEQDNFRKSFAGLLKKYPKVTFDKEIAFKNPDAEFFSFGHPLFEGEIKDGKGEVAGKRLFGFYTDGKEIRSISPGIIWELAEEEKAEGITVELEGLKKQTGNRVISKLEEYKKEILNERIRQTDIKQKYGIKSLEYLIVKLDGELISLYSRKESGEDVDLAIWKKEERKVEYEKALIVLKDEIQKEKSLTMSMPRFIGIIRVIPSDIIEKAMQRDDEIERIGMEVTMEYEKRNGRVPEDVADENLGFDIRSIDTFGKIRYIEVKARAETGAVALTQPEWFKALRFKDDYYLYAVMNAGGNPRLYIIRNPSETLEHEEKVEVVRFIVPFKEIIEKGDTGN